ncbi:MAG: transcription repressor NadR [Clostridia bacterium]
MKIMEHNKEWGVKTMSRRDKIIEILLRENNAVSGSELAAILDVSRQVIVQDVALLRASGTEIIATPQGYLLLAPFTHRLRKTIACKHKKEDIKDELTTIVDEGGTILDVIVEHSIYGQISGNIMVSSRREIDEFIEKVYEKGTKPLSDLTGGVHLHTIEYKSAQDIRRIEAALLEKRYLLME